jgi:hypothetical protein
MGIKNDSFAPLDSAHGFSFALSTYRVGEAALQSKNGEASTVDDCKELSNSQVSDS